MHYLSFLNLPACYLKRHRGAIGSKNFTCPPWEKSDIGGQCYLYRHLPQRPGWNLLHGDCYVSRFCLAGSKDRELCRTHIGSACLRIRRMDKNLFWLRHRPQTHSAIFLFLVYFYTQLLIIGLHGEASLATADAVRQVKGLNQRLSSAPLHRLNRKAVSRSKHQIV